MPGREKQQARFPTGPYRKPSALKDVDLLSKEQPKRATCYVRSSRALESVDPEKIRGVVAECCRKEVKDIPNFCFERVVSIGEARYSISFDVDRENILRRVETCLLKDVAAKLSTLVKNDVKVDVGYIVTVWQSNRSAAGILAAFKERNHASDYIRKVCDACRAALLSKQTNKAIRDWWESRHHREVREVVDYARHLVHELYDDDDFDDDGIAMMDVIRVSVEDARFDEMTLTFDLDPLLTSDKSSRSLEFGIEPFDLARCCTAGDGIIYVVGQEFRDTGGFETTPIVNVAATEVEANTYLRRALKESLARPLDEYTPVLDIEFPHVPDDVDLGEYPLWTRPVAPRHLLGGGERAEKPRLGWYGPTPEIDFNFTIWACAIQRWTDLEMACLFENSDGTGGGVTLWVQRLKVHGLEVTPPTSPPTITLNRCTLTEENDELRAELKRWRSGELVCRDVIDVDSGAVTTTAVAAQRDNDKNSPLPKKNARRDAEPPSMLSQLVQIKTDAAQETLRLQDRLENATLCAVCFENPRDVLFTACGHFLACGSCADNLLAKHGGTRDSTSAPCPNCREPINSMVTCRLVLT